MPDRGPSQLPTVGGLWAGCWVFGASPYSPVHQGNQTTFLRLPSTPKIHYSQDLLISPLPPPPLLWCDMIRILYAKATRSNSKGFSCHCCVWSNALPDPGRVQRQVLVINYEPASRMKNQALRQYSAWSHKLWSLKLFTIYSQVCQKRETKKTTWQIWNQLIKGVSATSPLGSGFTFHDCIVISQYLHTIWQCI